MLTLRDIRCMVSSYVMGDEGNALCGNMTAYYE